jgi:uncharacterized protein
VKLEQSFELAAPIDRVWAALNDLEQVAPCLPGAAITERDEDGTCHGTFQVKLGPTTATYRGKIKIESADESTHTATLTARGTDERGRGDAAATIVNTLSEHDGATTVHVTISGPLARAGRMEDISNRLMRDFSTCLQSRLADAPTAPTGEEVTRGEAPPEAVAAAAPEGEMDAEAAAASAGATTAGTTARPAPPPPPPAQPVAAKPVGGIGERLRRRFGRSSARP